VRHSVEAIKDLPAEYKGVVVAVYEKGLRISFLVAAVCAVIALISSLWASGKGLARRDEEQSNDVPESE